MESNYWNSSLIPLKKRFFYTLALFAMVGNILDLFFLKISIHEIGFYVNIINFIIALFFVILTFVNNSYLNISGIIVIYSLVFNMLFSLLVDVEDVDFEKFFLRETVFIGIILMVTGFILKRDHILILGSFYLISLTMALVLGDNQFLLKNSILLFTTSISYVLFLYYLLGLLEKSYIKQQEYLNELTNQNQILQDQKLELEKLNSTKEKLFSVISHDLKNPIGNLVGYGDLLAKNIEMKNWDKAAFLAGIISKSANRGCNLLNNLINWSRSQTNRIEFNPAQTDVYIILDKALKLYENQILEKEITISLNVKPFLIIKADENILSIVFTNLLSNAIKFTNRGGKIVFSHFMKDHEIIFTVSDNGIGIDDDIKNLLFELHDNISKFGTEGEPGSGLGLFMCKELIKIHGGHIWAESVKGEGSKFLFSLPLHN